MTTYRDGGAEGSPGRWRLRLRQRVVGLRRTNVQVAGGEGSPSSDSEEEGEGSSSSSNSGGSSDGDGGGCGSEKVVFGTPRSTSSVVALTAADAGVVTAGGGHSGRGSGSAAAAAEASREVTQLLAERVRTSVWTWEQAARAAIESRAAVEREMMIGVVDAETSGRRAVESEWEGRGREVMAQAAAEKEQAMRVDELVVGQLQSAER